MKKSTLRALSSLFFVAWLNILPEHACATQDVPDNFADNFAVEPLPLHLEATPELAQDFFDFFQMASLPLGTPIYISHASRDAQWLYVEYPQLGGWVRATDVATVSKDFTRAYRTGQYGAVVNERVMLTAPPTPEKSELDSAKVSPEGNTSDPTKLGLVHIGAVFPFAVPASGTEDTPKVLTILVPVRHADGSASIARVRPPEGAVLPKPLALTPMALAQLGNKMLGQPSSWGGCITAATAR